MTRRLSPALFCALLLPSCSDGATVAGTSTGAQITPPAEYAMSVQVTLTADDMGIPLFTQSGSTIHVPVSEVAGKTYIWATTPGGEPPGNASPLEFGTGIVDPGLSFKWTTKAMYTDGPWEMSMFISVAGADPFLGPQKDDIAMFSLADPPAGDPPITGNSVRMHIDGADAALSVDNSYFIRFTK